MQQGATAMFKVMTFTACAFSMAMVITTAFAG
jgi:hypothetical protein